MDCDWIMLGALVISVAVLSFYQWQICRLFYRALSALSPEVRGQVEASLALGHFERCCMRAVPWTIAGLVIGAVSLVFALLCMKSGMMR